MRAPKDKDPTVAVHIRLAQQDVRLLQKMAAASGVSWQTELRMLVHRSLKGERREVMILKDD